MKMSNYCRLCGTSLFFTLNMHYKVCCSAKSSTVLTEKKVCSSNKCTELLTTTSHCSWKVCSLRKKKRSSGEQNGGHGQACHFSQLVLRGGGGGSYCVWMCACPGLSLGGETLWLQTPPWQGCSASLQQTCYFDAPNPSWPPVRG